MDESGKQLGREKGKDQMKKTVSAAEAGKLAAEQQRVPGTENYRPKGGDPVGRDGIEGAGIVGHHNLERETEVEKYTRKQRGVDSFEARAPFSRLFDKLD